MYITILSGITLEMNKNLIKKFKIGGMFDKEVPMFGKGSKSPRKWAFPICYHPVYIRNGELFELITEIEYFHRMRNIYD